MATTWYVSIEDGSDNNSGDSFAVTLTGASLVANGSTTVTSAGGGFTGLAGRKIFIVGGGSGYNINSVTNDTTAVLNAGPGAGTYTFSVGGRRATINNMSGANCQGITGGDTVRVMGSVPPTSLGVDTNWMNGNNGGTTSPTIIMSGTSKLQICSCDSGFTASGNVTATVNSSDFKEGTGSAQIVVASAFTTGKAAYFATGTLNLSTYQIIRFWLKQTAGTPINNGTVAVTVSLCSDVAGATPVNTITLPKLPTCGAAAGGTQNTWIPLSFDTGGALGSSIKSIAINVTANSGGFTVLLDDFEACTAPALTQLLANCDGLWTASSNVTVTNTNARKEGTNCVSIAVAAAFTTGLAAYFPTGTLNLSGYQQLSFWLKQTAGTMLAASGMSLRLCSDAAGAVSVNTIPLPVLTNAPGVFGPFTVNYGGALGSSIQSIALYVDTDVGAQTILIDNIMACLAPGNTAISLTSLLGKTNSVGAGGNDTETWYAIQSINNNTIILDQDPGTTINNGLSHGYWGVQEFATGYKRETIKTPYVSSQLTDINVTQLAGSAGNILAFEGGWDRTSMSTQNLTTWLDGTFGYGNGLHLANGYTSLNLFACVRYYNGVDVTTANCTIRTLTAINNCGGSGMTVSAAANCAVTTIQACCNNSLSGNGIVVSASQSFTLTKLTQSNANAYGIQFSGNCGQAIVTTITLMAMNNTYNVYFNASNGIKIGTITLSTGVAFGSGIGFITASNNYIGSVTSNNNQYGMTFNPAHANVIGSAVCNLNTSDGINFANSSDNIIYSLSTTGNGIAGIGMDIGINYLKNVTINEATPTTNNTLYGNFRLHAMNSQGVTGAFKIYTDGGAIVNDNSTIQASTGYSWKLSPTSANRSVNYPLTLSLCRFACAANITYTVTCYARRDNTGLTQSLVCKGGQLNGVAADVTATSSEAANTWGGDGSGGPLSITFTPTEAGTIEIQGQVYGGTTYNGWFDTLTVNNGSSAIIVSLDSQSLWTGPGLDPLVLTGGGAFMLGHL